MKFPNHVIAMFNDRLGFDLERSAIMACRRGSRVYGTATSVSDDDFFVVVIPPIEKLLGLSTFDNWTFQDDAVDVVVYSLRKYVGLLLKNNPSVLETLWYRDEDYDPELTTPAFTQLKNNRDIFSSLRAYHSFSGYAYDQLRRMTLNVTSGYMGEKRRKLVTQFGYDTKNASHLLRLYRMGTEFVETGVMAVLRPDADELLAVKQGKWTLEQVKAEAERLRARMESAKERSPLPAEPNTQKAEGIMLHLLRAALVDI
jgi:hypothetical protein